MISRQVYRFDLEARTPLYFGGTEAGKLLTRANGQPVVSGNAIGGLLREWMKNNKDLLGIDPLVVMGDEEMESEKRIFRESKIQIDDGKVCLPHAYKKFPEKVGVAIDPKTGAPLKGQQYTYEYLPVGTRIKFEVSCDLGESSFDANLTKENLLHLMSAWAAAIDHEEVRWGGKKSLRFGVCKIVSFVLEDYDFSSANAIDAYLFERRPTSVHILKPKPLKETVTVFKLQMQGSFPYGVYMADFENRLPAKQSNGKQQISIPSSSLKGLIRSEVRRLVFKILSHADSVLVERKAEQITNILFGGADLAGIITVHDLQINGIEVKVIRSVNQLNDDFPFSPKYVKIDRITGGVVESQLRRQREVQGDGKITLEVRPTSNQDPPFDLDTIWFPLIYVLRRIGSGQLPIGGRTSIGLGIFHAHELRIELPGDSPRTFIVNIYGYSDKETMDWLRRSYERFMEWCYDEMEMD